VPLTSITLYFQRTELAMRGVFLVCVLYAGLPIAFLWLLAFLSNGFPLVPVLLGAGFLGQFLLERR